MEVIEFFESGRREHWLGEMEKCEWSAGQQLHRILKNGEFFDVVGEGSKVLLLTDGDRLVSFCTYAKYDDVQPTELSPWMGFVFTFPEYRGHRYVGRLFEKAVSLAREDNISEFYISTTHTGLYEKYGCEFKMNEIDVSHEPTKVYVKKIDG